jgi:hypothetical protein
MIPAQGDCVSLGDEEYHAPEVFRAGHRTTPKGEIQMTAPRLEWNENGRAEGEHAVYFMQDFKVRFKMKNLPFFLTPIQNGGEIYFSSEDDAKDWCQSYEIAILTVISEAMKKEKEKVKNLEIVGEQLRCALDKMPAISETLLISKDAALLAWEGREVGK